MSQGQHRSKAQREGTAGDSVAEAEATGTVHGGTHKEDVGQPCDAGDSVLKRREILTCVTTRLNLEDVRQVRSASHKRTNPVGLHFYEVPGVATSVETESKKRGARDLGGAMGSDWK